MDPEALDLGTPDLAFIWDLARHREGASARKLPTIQLHRHRFGASFEGQHGSKARFTKVVFQFLF